MNTLDLVGHSAPKPFPKCLPSVGGLFAAGAVASLICRLPLPLLVACGLLGATAASLSAVFLTSAVTVWGLGTIQPETSAIPARRLILRTSCDALWLAPLALFLCTRSVWAMPMAALFVACVTRSFWLFKGSAGEACDQ